LKVESSTAQKVCAVITTNKQQANGEKPSNIATTNRLLRERRPSVVEKNKNKNREGEGYIETVRMSLTTVSLLLQN